MVSSEEVTDTGVKSLGGGSVVMAQGCLEGEAPGSKTDGGKASSKADLWEEGHVHTATFKMGNQRGPSG